MGNIRTSFVKRISKELIETHQGKFTTDFEENKKLVAEYSTVSTKHLRNKIAGYITRLVRQQANQAYFYFLLFLRLINFNLPTFL